MGGKLRKERSLGEGRWKKLKGCQVSCAVRMWGFGPVSGPRVSRPRSLQGEDTVKQGLGTAASPPHNAAAPKHLTVRKAT